METVSSNSPACTYRTLEGNIQEFVLKEVSRRAVDELFDITEQNLQNAVGTETPTASAVLIDSSVGLQSLNYSMIRLRAMMSRFPAQKNGSIALLMPSNPLVRTVSLIMRSIAPVRIYAPHEREQAIAWLRSTMEASSKR
jgi:hypothetical protein